MDDRITSMAEFRHLLSSSNLLVITDHPHRTACLHLDPAGCSHVQERSFEKKVVQNREANGQYFRVGSEADARERWPQLKLCSSAACGAAFHGRR